MRALPVSAVNWIAGLVVLGGAAWAGTLAFGPRDAGPDVANLQALADRLAGQRGPTLGDRDAGGRRVASDEPELIGMPRVDYAALRRAKQRLAAANATPAEAPTHVEPTPPPTTPPPAPEPTEPADDELKNLALVGVTSADGKDAALLVHLESQERESVSVGGSILGFKVKAIQPDAVVLTRGTQDHTLRLGDHDVVQASAAGGSDSDDDDDGSPFGRRDRGEDRSRFAGGFGGFGDRTFQAGDFRQRGGDGDRRQWTPTDTSGFSGRDNQDRRDGRSDRGGRSTTSGFSTPVFGGGFGGFGGGFGGFSSRNRQNTGSTSTFAAGAGGSSTNPQTARRRGTQATGDGASQPEPISNPQTQRRRGTSNEPAFGEADNSARQSSSGRGR